MKTDEKVFEFLADPTKETFLKCRDVVIKDPYQRQAFSFSKRNEMEVRIEEEKPQKSGGNFNFLNQ